MVPPGHGVTAGWCRNRRGAFDDSVVVKLPRASGRARKRNCLAGNLLASDSFESARQRTGMEYLDHYSSATDSAFVKEHATIEPIMTDGATILLIDDHPAVRMGLGMLLVRGGCRIVGEAGCRSEALSALAGLAEMPQLAVLDLSLGEESGFDLIADLKQRTIPVLIYSMHEDARTVSEAFSRGAAGYLCKRDASNELVGAVSAVLSGERYVSPLIAESTNASGGLQPPASEVVLDPLSDREREIIALMGRGHSQAEIARALLISVRTVETHCERAINKLGLGGMKDLRRHAIQVVRR